MRSLASLPPDRFVAAFFASFTEEVVHGDQPPEEAMRRYYTPDIIQLSDGVPLDWERLVAHVRPVRRNLVEARYEVHEAMADGQRIAARLTIHARMRKRDVATQVHLFAEFTPEGLMRRSVQLTRALPDEPPAEEDQLESHDRAASYADNPPYADNPRGADEALEAGDPTGAGERGDTGDEGSQRCRTEGSR
ncbi:nuclear transport factor 2 family protein [Streptomyces sp. AJS327]|uniref:nuclear transport factor 2 family protein n=1 Tax=Streptomyces sp. AJS327 TaxID=2545265 RepID=UPI001C610DD4|nr:nuclear transport factor 2 family protein [Streptomyces sp. AJS327]